MMFGSRQQTAPRDRRPVCLFVLLAMILTPVFIQFWFGAEDGISSIPKRTVTNNVGAVDETERDLLMAMTSSPTREDPWNFHGDDMATGNGFHYHTDRDTPSSSDTAMNPPRHRNNNPIRQQGRWSLSADSLQEYHRHRIEENRKRKYIRAMVSTVVAFLGPLIVVLVTVAFQKWCGSPPTKKRRIRSEKIRRGLESSQHRWIPTISTTNTSGVEPPHHQQSPAIPECPICLSTFAEGEIVIVPKHCHCSIPARGNATDAIAATSSNLPHRIFFHEECIVTWLSHKKANPKKLCPCCRHPFLGLSKR